MKKGPLPWFAPCAHCPSDAAPEQRRPRLGGGVVWVCPACGAAREPLQTAKRVRAGR